MDAWGIELPEPPGAEAAEGQSVAAVICAAGSSKRMGGVKKEYRPLPGGGRTVLGAAVSAFAAVTAVDIIVIVVPADAETGEAAARAALPPELLAAGARPPIVFTPGGETRRASVHRALSLLAQYRPAYALIHDGARPWVSPVLINRLIEAARRYRAVIPLLPLAETPKVTDLPLAGADAAPVVIKRHLRRANTGAAQTPQAFAFPEILAAHNQAADHAITDNAEYTDDAEVWAAFCGPVTAIAGLPENRKITFPEDLR
jgi:2-C-methyl-D-erythritol 4-phosphate cytidylyltransferase/2-C-methyl-D-erythritol 4-phosphate cytidylyltransferase/2-C-methyl-D-erythritol 2,4-cyclodiphosphate synthase